MAETPHRPPSDILLVEDDPGGARLTREAFREAGFAGRVSVVGNGEEALDYLHHRGRHRNASRPRLILLDLGLPRMSGTEVLAEVKADPELRRIPVLVLTSSSAPEDVAMCYDLHANCFFTKPLDFGELMRMARSIGEFWGHVAEPAPG